MGVGENNEEEGGFMAAKKKSQCQCWKHQFWKKLEMNISLVSNAEYFFCFFVVSNVRSFPTG